MGSATRSAVCDTKQIYRLVRIRIDPRRAGGLRGLTDQRSGPCERHLNIGRQTQGAGLEEPQYASEMHFLLVVTRHGGTIKLNSNTGSFIPKPMIERRRLSVTNTEYTRPSFYKLKEKIEHQSAAHMSEF